MSMQYSVCNTSHIVPYVNNSICKSIFQNNYTTNLKHFPTGLKTALKGVFKKQSKKTVTERGLTMNFSCKKNFNVSLSEEELFTIIYSYIKEIKSTAANLASIDNMLQSTDEQIKKNIKII